MLAGVLCMPLISKATDAAPDGVTFAPTPIAAPAFSIQSAAVFSVSAEQWNAPCMEAQVSRERPQERFQHNGETLVILPGLLAVMQQVMQQPNSGVVLHYPEDERGEIWAEELRDWLVALGLPSNRIQLIPGSSGDVINISHVAIVKNPADEKNTLSPVITEPFQIKEATDVVNGVEIP